MTTLEDVRRLPGLDSYLEEIEVRLAAAVASYGGRAAEVGADAPATACRRVSHLPSQPELRSSSSTWRRSSTTI